MKMDKMNILGEILKEEFMDPLCLSPAKLASDLNVPEDDIRGIIDGKIRMNPKMSIKLGKYFGMSYDFFMNIQIEEDARNKKED